MKTLPPLSLDLRRAALEASAKAGGDYVDVIDVHERTIARVFSIDGNYDHAGVIVDRLNGWEQTVNALRALAIVPTQKSGVQAVVHDGYRCRVCASTWKLKQSEQHQGWCQLKDTVQKT